MEPVVLVGGRYTVNKKAGMEERERKEKQVGVEITCQTLRA